MNSTAIKVSNISKTFKLPHEKHTSIKGAVLNIFRRKKTYEKQQVLNDVSFEIKKGEFFGIVGRNGSGKSTLLKLLASIYTPDTGGIQINGKLTPFIELGVGFNPELTGRENVYLNGALLGFNRKQVSVMYDEIVEFAELDEFMDQKLKNYSSGMQVRLAFSIAIRAKSDILLIDEVLAVGDEAFQAKCFDVFEAYKSTGRTVVLVTHDMGIVNRFCNRALHIKKGKITLIGAPQMVAKEYREANEQLIDEQVTNLNETQNRPGLIIELKNKSNSPAVRFKYNEEIQLDIDYTAYKDEVEGLGVALYKATGEYVFGTNTFVDKTKLNKRNGKIQYRIKAAVSEGTYHFKIGLFGKSDSQVIKFIDDGPKFRIDQSNQGWEGITELAHSWSIQNV